MRSHLTLQLLGDALSKTQSAWQNLGRRLRSEESHRCPDHEQE
jgi:hypothetical protein